MDSMVPTGAVQRCLGAHRGEEGYRPREHQGKSPNPAWSGQIM